LQGASEIDDIAIGRVIGAHTQLPLVLETEAVFTIALFVFSRWGIAARQRKNTPSAPVAITFLLIRS
jgi:hypothetical protein